MIVHEVNNPICVSNEATQDKGKGQISPEIEVNIVQDLIFLQYLFAVVTPVIAIFFMLIGPISSLLAVIASKCHF